jgi:hypothetical protein
VTEPIQMQEPQFRPYRLGDLNAACDFYAHDGSICCTSNASISISRLTPLTSRTPLVNGTPTMAVLGSTRNDRHRPRPTQRTSGTPFAIIKLPMSVRFSSDPPTHDRPSRRQIARRRLLTDSVSVICLGARNDCDRLGSEQCTPP